MLVGSKQCLKHGYCYRHNCLVSDTSAGPMPYNLTCILVNKSADFVAMMPGLLVRRK